MGPFRKGVVLFWGPNPRDSNSENYPKYCYSSSYCCWYCCNTSTSCSISTVVAGFCSQCYCLNYEYHCCYFLVLLPNLLAIIVSVNMKVSSANIVVNILAITSVFSDYDYQYTYAHSSSSSSSAFCSDYCGSVGFRVSRSLKLQALF